METFTATLYWPDAADERYQDDERIVVPLGPDGTPPLEHRVGVHAEGHQMVDIYKLDEYYDLPHEVYYQHTDLEIRS